MSAQNAAAQELSPPTRTLIDELIAEQQSLTAVTKFSRKHERNELPSQAKYYRDLIPLSKPNEGEQYAFAVDLDACTGCKACVTACHALNGLDENEAWRDVGVLFGGTSIEPVQQTITTACHHCVDPACLSGCPVMAYEKDEITGIVRHLDDQCIGCQYCILKCPYDVPKYSKKRGIVRKCDMCSNRLAVGEAPACVQSCPSEAIRIETVRKSEVAASAEAQERLVAGAFDSSYTLPTTQYFSRKELPENLAPGDAHALKPEHAHWPLIFMLVLTQMSAGIFAISPAFAWLTDSQSFRQLAAMLSLGGFLALNAGLAVSVLHLGRPLGAWRFFLGLRTSWMSREILAFSIFAGSAMLSTAAACWPWMVALFPRARWMELLLNPTAWALPLATVTALLGLISIFCSAMIYVDTQRVFWRWQMTLPKFFGTSALLGLHTTLLVVAARHGFDNPILKSSLCLGVIAVCAAKLLSELSAFRHLAERGWSPMRRTALVMALRLPFITNARLLCGIIGGVIVPALMLMRGVNMGFAVAALALCALGEMFERQLFFMAVTAPKMPGGIAA